LLFLLLIGRGRADKEEVFVAFAVEEEDEFTLNLAIKSLMPFFSSLLQLALLLFPIID
jgi:hypothetical protein